MVVSVNGKRKVTAALALGQNRVARDFYHGTNLVGGRGTGSTRAPHAPHSAVGTPGKGGRNNGVSNLRRARHRGALAEEPEPPTQTPTSDFDPSNHVTFQNDSHAIGGANEMPPEARRAAEALGHSMIQAPEAEQAGGDEVGVSDSEISTYVAQDRPTALPKKGAEVKEVVDPPLPEPTKGKGKGAGGATPEPPLPLPTKGKGKGPPPPPPPVAEEASPPKIDPAAAAATKLAALGAPKAAAELQQAAVLAKAKAAPPPPPITPPPPADPEEEPEPPPPYEAGPKAIANAIPKKRTKPPPPIPAGPPITMFRVRPEEAERLGRAAQMHAKHRPPDLIQKVVEESENTPLYDNNFKLLHEVDELDAAQKSKKGLNGKELTGNKRGAKQSTL